MRDVHSVLEVSVYDEDREKKVDFLGKVVIPLLMVRIEEIFCVTCNPNKGLLMVFCSCL